MQGKKLSFEQIQKVAKNAIILEKQAIESLLNSIDDDFCRVVELIFGSHGRVIVTGIGKSAIIAQKIVATFNSTGTPAVFMHAADAIHGDLGIIQDEDVVICISKSGNTPEIKVLIPLIKKFGNPLIAMVSNFDSQLAKYADFVLKIPIEQEACPNNLAPTSSTTAQLAMGDAVAVALLDCRGFSSDDFARYHPGGSLGKRLYMKVSDLYLNNQVPQVMPDCSVSEVILEISSKRLGATAVVDAENNLCGIITDGDIRRMLQKHSEIGSLRASDIMSRNPKTVDKDLLAVKAFEIMRSKSITQLLVTENDRYLGIVHIHDILREGII